MITTEAERQLFWRFKMRPIALAIKVAIAQGKYQGIK